MRWEEKYRPRKFTEVRGQPSAVTILSGLAAKKSHRHAILLRGAVGSGKTTLARLYAQALNCGHQDTDGSPCQVCESCGVSAAYLKEYNAPLLSAEGGKIQAILEDEGRPLDDGKVKVLFFDEAQGLSRADQQLLLKIVEDPPARVVFCFATTDVHMLSPALKSRLFEIEIKPIETAIAIELLEHIAEHEHVPYDNSAFLMLTAAVPPQARDLVKKLEELHALGRHIDVHLVKQVCGLSVCDSLSAYAVALAEGDRQKQTAAFMDWHEAIPAKVRRLQRFLLTSYYNDILGQRVVIDPLCSSMNHERLLFVRALSERTGKRNPRRLAPILESWLNFWAGVALDDDEVVMLKLAQFEKLANGDVSISTEYARSKADVESQRKPAPVTPNFCQTWEVYFEAPGCRFVEREHVREIVNRASALTQLHGVHFNALFRIESVEHAEMADEESLSAALSCANRLKKLLGCAGSCSGIVVVERFGGAIVAQLGLHIPWLGADGETQKSPESGIMSLQEGGFEVRSSRLANRDRARFHWDVIRELCAGFDDGEQAGQELSVRSILDIRRGSQRAAGPFDALRLAFTGDVASAAIAGACENDMAIVSAFDSGAWPQITTNWEIKEFFDRREEAKRRRTMLSQLETRHRGDALAAEKAVAELRQYWASLPPGSWARTWNKDW